jgi:hypothetical protein
MKTAEEYVKDIHGYDLDAQTTATLVKSYREYARQVAEQVLKDATKKQILGKTATLIVLNILTTEIKTP